MIDRRNGFRRIVPALAVAGMLAVASASAAWAAPGDPLGGDDTGCAPTEAEEHHDDAGRHEPVAGPDVAPAVAMSRGAASCVESR